MSAFQKETISSLESPHRRIYSPSSVKTRLRRSANKPKPVVAVSDIHSDTSSILGSKTSTSRRRKRDSFSTSTKLEDEWSLTTLTALRAQFNKADEDSNGRLSMEEFLKAFSSKTDNGHEYLVNLFHKIDVSDDQSITWDEFATYMLLEYQKRHDAYVRSKTVDVMLPFKPLPTSHRGSLSRMRMSNDQLITMTESGNLCFWSATKEMHPVKKKHSLRLQSTGTSIANARKHGWATDFALAPAINKFVVTSGGRELWFYDLKTLKATFIITDLEETPLKVDSAEDVDETVIIIADRKGCMSALTFPPNSVSANGFRNSDATRPGEPAQISMAYLSSHPAQFGGVTHVRWSVHGDWIVEMLFSKSLRAIISASNDPETALAIGEIIKPALDMPQSIDIDPNGPSAHFFVNEGPGLRSNPSQLSFQIKKGVKCMCFSEKQNMVATGGLDRQIRIWNPLVNFRPTGVLEGHAGPIEALAVQDETGRLFSISADHELKVWSLNDFSCLTTFTRRQHQFTADIQGLLFNPQACSLIAFGDQVFSLPVNQDASIGPERELTHSSSIVSCLFNKRFGQVVTADVQGVIRVWDYKTAQLQFEFSIQHHQQYSPVTKIVLDRTSRRILVSQVDGSISIWNYNNGQLLRQLDKSSPSEVCCLCYCVIGTAKFVAAGGWDRQLFIFPDHPDNDLLASSVTPISRDWRKASEFSDDIIGVAFKQPNLLLAASYDGLIQVWNLSSASLLKVLRTCDDETSNKKKPSLVDVQFVPFSKSSAVALESTGTLHCWSYIIGGLPSWSYDVELEPLVLTTCFCQYHHTIFVGTSTGFVIVLKQDNKTLVEQTRFQSSLASIRDICVLEDEDGQSVDTQDQVTIVVCSQDGRARLWKEAGSYLATFGQALEYDHLDFETWRQNIEPYRPKDIVEAEEMQARRMEEEQLAAEQLEELELNTIEEDEGSENDSDDEYFRPSTALQRQLDGSRSRTAKPPSSSSSGTRATTAKLSSRRASRPTLSASESTLYRLRQENPSTFSSAKALGPESYAFERRSNPRQRKTSRRIASAPSLRRFTEKSAGNWKRHLHNSPYKLSSSETIYMKLPYHHIKDEAIATSETNS